MVAFSITPASLLLLALTPIVKAFPTWKPVARVSAPKTSEYVPFNLKTVVTRGNASRFANLYVVTQHTGAGENAAALFPNGGAFNFSSGNGGFVLNHTHIDLYFGKTSTLPIYSLGLDSETPYMSNVSTANKYVDLNGIRGQGTPGFLLNSNGLISYDGNTTFKTFTACAVPKGIAPYLGGPEIELLWRNTSTVPDLVHCADVRLTAEF